MSNYRIDIGYGHVDVRGYPVGLHLIVHRSHKDPRVWRITHRNTGVAFVKDLFTYRAAMVLATKIRDSGIDLDFSTAEELDGREADVLKLRKIIEEAES